MMIMKEQLNEWRALCEAATDGPWVVNVRQCGDGVSLAERSVGRPGLPQIAIIADNAPSNSGRGKIADANTRFMAVSRIVLPQLLDEVECLKSEQAALMASFDKAEAACGLHPVTGQPLDEAIHGLVGAVEAYSDE